MHWYWILAIGFVGGYLFADFVNRAWGINALGTAIKIFWAIAGLFGGKKAAA